MDLIVLAIVAAFILYRLYMVLGQDVGFKQDLNAKVEPKSSEKKKGFTSGAQPTHFSADIAALQALDPHFEENEFLEGASGAFAMVLEAMNKGDKNTLQMLMAPRLFNQFNKLVDNRESKKQTLENTLVRIKSMDIQEIEVKDSMVFITVKILSEQILVIRDSGGNVLEGDPDQIETLTDIITFSRDTRSADPNWMMVKTSNND